MGKSIYIYRRSIQEVHHQTNRNSRRREQKKNGEIKEISLELKKNMTF